MNEIKNTPQNSAANTPSGLATDDCSPPLTREVCQCHNWAVLEPHKTFHHPNCKLVDESLIDVFKVTLDGNYFFTDNPLEVEKGSSVVKTKMHREIYDRLPESVSF